MNKKKTAWIWVAVIAAVLLSCGAGFLVGRQTTASAWQAERERAILLSRSDLEGLGEIQGTIYVTGHKSPDSDTVGSAIGYAALLQKLGYDAQAVTLEEINNETRYVLESGGIEPPMLLEDASGCNMVLVDHSEYSQSADGLADAKVISIIDHHGAGSVTTGNQLIYDARPLGSTATIVWLRYRDYGVEVDPKAAYAMAGSILSDTQNLKANATFADREALQDLARIAGIADTDALFQEMFKASLSYGDMTDEEIFFSDCKEYESGGTKYSIGCVNAYDEAGAKDMAARMKAVLPAARDSAGMDMAFAQISIFHDDISVVYLVASDEAADEVLKTAFGDETFDGTAYRFEPGFARKTVLVPAITDVLQAHPKE